MFSGLFRLVCLAWPALEIGSAFLPLNQFCRFIFLFESGIVLLTLAVVEFGADPYAVLELAVRVKKVGADFPDSKFHFSLFPGRELVFGQEEERILFGDIRLPVFAGRLFVKGGSLILDPIDSIRLNGKRVTKVLPLAAGDEVRIGDFTFRIEDIQAVDESKEGGFES